MKSIALFSSLVVLIVAQQDGQQWGINFAPSNGDSNGLNGFFSGITGFFEGQKDIISKRCQLGFQIWGTQSLSEVRPS